MADPNQHRCLFDRVMDVAAPIFFLLVLVGLPLKLWMSNPDGFWNSGGSSAPAGCSVVGIAERCF